MTVQELIDKLNEIEDKSIKTTVYSEGYVGCGYIEIDSSDINVTDEELQIG